ncbi:hypothetical protein [Nostoc sp.]|uniref:hypothetical protein n=1 Tax=Nostoc sp. TaxID=1180 RepID=UPI002FFAEF94
MNNVIQVTYWEIGTIIPSSGIENAVTGHGKLDTPFGDKGRWGMRCVTNALYPMPQAAFMKSF